MSRLHLTLVACACVLGLAAVCRADKMKLKDGTVIEGTVIKNQDSYWIKPYNGDDARTIPADQVDSVERGSGDASGDSSSASAGTSASFNVTKRKAEASDTADQAVALWTTFLASCTDPTETGLANQELARWKKLAADGAERINGKWVSGDERKAIVAQAAALFNEAMKLINENQTLAAMKKLDEAAKIYPNNFQVIFFTAYLDLLSHKEDDAIKLLDACRAQRPNSAAVLNNYGIALVGKKEFDKAVLMFQHSAELEDTQQIAQNLVSAISLLTDHQRGEGQFKEAIEDAQLLSSKYRVAGPRGTYALMLGDHSGEKGGPDGGAEETGSWAEGTGFFLTADGLILTNHHVIADAKKLTVTLPGGQTVPAEVVVIDDQQDLALIRIKPPTPMPFIHFAASDHPGDGAECVALGYPLIDRLGAKIKITRGIVSSGNNGNPLGADILTDTKVNPGNSGGPLVNTHGSVIGIVTLKSISTSTEDSYGMAIGAGHIRMFLAKNKVDITPGDDTAAPLTPEEIAAKIEPATVCIIAQH